MTGYLGGLCLRKCLHFIFILERYFCLKHTSSVLVVTLFHQGNSALNWGLPVATGERVGEDPGSLGEPPAAPAAFAVCVVGASVLCPGVDFW